ncbi:MULTISPECIES: outer membrane protein [Buttiauxella]|jgi:outer membrane immunogenic protein|uniref:Outer membrane protein n=1 Tax=Buttiauxella ferragutiae ATCC 51602 TaxID=1354252 RepID=A0ABX2W2K0_9ENTR|nr:MULTISPECIES: outer membrane beta-barrel protein [Buttiauxella]OAT24575.1 outer membrane protein [Buttiauxella ferragutiae ATCC 51602]TDN51877.1 outer membrane immunogenic protein [Buttiauxella sp. JUb87]
MRKTLLVIVMLLSSGSAFADSAKSFDGWYVGGNLGYGSGTNQDVSVSPGAGEPHGTPRDIDGTIGGIQAGYNWQLDNDIVLGVETGFSGANISGGLNNPSHSSWYDEVDINQAFNLNFKAGYAIGNWLPYVTAGLTVASMELAKGCSVNPAPAVQDCGTAFNTAIDDTRAGYNVGAGVEWKFSDNFSTALEYRYTDLGESDAFTPVGANDAYPKFKTDYSEVTLRVNYYF